MHPRAVLLSAFGFLFSALFLAVPALASASASWVAYTPIPISQYTQTAAVLDGKIYVAGGSDSTETNAVPTEVYDPSTNTWTALASVGVNAGGGKVLALNGNIYYLGGFMPFQGFFPVVRGDLKMYDAGTNTWVAKAPMPTTRAFFAVGVINGKIYATGGEQNGGGGGSGLDELDIYDPVTDSWSTGAPIPTARRSTFSTVLNGKFYVIGGDQGGSPTNEVLVYDPVSNTWTTDTPVPTVIEHGSASIVNGRMHLLGGTDGGVNFNTNYVFDAATHTWSTDVAMPITPTAFASAAVGNTLYAITGTDLVGITEDPTVAYYRFENGTDGSAATSITDSSSNSLNGTILTGSPTYSASVFGSPVPLTSEANTLSMNFGTNDAASFAYPFPFNNNNDATLEFWIFPDGSSGGTFLWATTAGGDANRFHIHWGLDEVFADYREPGGPGHDVGRTGVDTVPVGQWSFVAIVKTGDTYKMYVNSSATGNQTTLGSTVTDTSPNLPNSTGWTINGRCFEEPNCGGQFKGLLDEIRLSNQALTPAQFLKLSQPPTTGFLTIHVSSPGGNDVFSFDGSLGVIGIATALATESGDQPFSQIQPGSYTINFIPKAGWTLTSNNCTNVVVTAGNLSECTIVITKNASTPVITTTSLSAGIVGTAYSQTLLETGGSGPFTWSLKSGTLPAGLTLSSAGVLSGTPTASTTRTFTVKVVDSNSASSTQVLTLQIVKPLVQNLASLPPGKVGNPYSKTLFATQGLPPYTWSVVAGALPAGLSLDISSGIVSGTPTTAGTSDATIQVTDSLSQTASKGYTVTISALHITTASLPNGKVGAAYSKNLAAAGGTTPLTWSVIGGALAGGLTLDPSGVISGAPTAAGTFNVTVQVSDTNGITDSKSYSFIINTLHVTTANVPKGIVGAAYTKNLAAAGGTTPYTWSLAGGTLPNGLSVDPTGALVGTPTVVGAFTFTLQVTDANNVSDTMSFTASTTKTTVTTGTLPNGKVGNAYSKTLAANNGTAPYTWSVNAGTLPAGLTLSAAGVLSGTPTSPGTANLTLSATDANGISGIMSSMLLIKP